MLRRNKEQSEKQNELEEKKWKKTKGFEFRKKGKLTKKEEKELERTHSNIFDWMKQADNAKEQGGCGEELELLGHHSTPHAGPFLRKFYPQVSK